jgi:arylsulfatase A-like enzyme
MDDNSGVVLDWLKTNGLDQNTIVVFTTDNGAEVCTWPDGGNTPFAGAKGSVTEGSFRVPATVRWPGKVPAGKVWNGIVSGLDWFPTLLAAAGEPTITGSLDASYDPRVPNIRIPRKVLKGGRTCARRITAGGTARPRAIRVL